MSRGLGTMQGDILAAYDAVIPTGVLYPWVCDKLADVERATMCQVREVASVRQLLIEQDQTQGSDEAYARYVRSWQASFCRALRSLIRRQRLRACSLYGRPLTPSRGERIQYVVKC